MDKYDIIDATTDLSKLEDDYFNWCTLPFKRRMRANDNCMSMHGCTVPQYYDRLRDAIVKADVNTTPNNVETVSEDVYLTPDSMEKDMELYESFNGGEAITFEDNNQALMDLEAGRIDAVVADEILVKYYIKLKGEDKFKVLTEDFGSEEYGVGIRKGDIETVEAVNNAFEEMKKDGKMAEISQKWFGEDITNN